MLLNPAHLSFDEASRPPHSVRLISSPNQKKNDFTNDDEES
jgi:hypothetical protein